jgi:RNA polymerase sigma factor (sigma-70 family)
MRLKLRELHISWAVEPDDLLDSFFIHLYNGGAKISIKDALHFTNYCERSLRNRCVGVLRSTIRRLTTRIDDCPPELLAEPDATDSEGSLEWEEQLAAAYARLTQRKRVICWLELGGYSWEEIARRLNVSAAAACKAHQRAVARVRGEVLAGRVILR